MYPKLIFNLLFLALCQVAPAQVRCGNGMNPPSLTPKLPQGDSSRAISARHRVHGENEMKVYFGFIDSTSAPLTEIWDNLEIGLTIPNNKYRVVKADLWYMPKGSDAYGPFPFKGNKVPRSLLENVKMYRLTKGDRLSFENIRIQKEGQEFTLPAKDVEVVVY